ncbi:carbohydrate ABC transporter permease [Paenibacillus thiaminolyticus]|uniref:carbohydrate ABC transporter permease n=1 Tax=Paenibacillus thiaminolyticus TaxID=49283 RepID=UPI003D282F5B
MRARSGDRWFNFINVTLLIVLAVITILPIIHVFAMSFVTTEESLSGRFILWPSTWTTEAYRYIFDTGVFFLSLKNTVWLTVVGTFINVILTALLAYVCSRPQFSARRVIMFLVLFTMLFGGGMIPTYLIVKGTGLINSLWALILPGAISAFNMLVMRDFFESLPESVIESARIDGCGDLRILGRIVFPLSLPILATFTLFYAVGNWNQYFSAILYLNDPDKWPLQILLRQVVLIGQADIFSNLDPNVPLPPSVSIQMATVVLASFPIVVLYPFLQRYFVQGLTLGAVKG